MENEQNRLALEKARNLIKEKKYKQAVEILKTVDSPTAKLWLEKLQNQLQPQVQDRKNSSSGQSIGLIVVLVLIIGALLGGIIGFFIGRQTVLYQLASAFAGSSAFSSTSTLVPYTNSDTPAATVTLEQQIITRIVNAYTFDPIDLKGVAATDTDIFLEIQIDEMSSLTLLGGALEPEIVNEMARTVCVLHGAGFLQTYNINALTSVADDFGQDEYSVVASARLEPETREKLDCSNPYEINLPAIADEWTISE